MSLANVVIGVPTPSTIAAAAAAKQNKTTLEMLLNIQKSLDEFKKKLSRWTKKCGR